MDFKTIWDFIQTGGVAALLLVIIVGGGKQWWVFGWQHNEVKAERDEARDEIREQTALIQNTYMPAMAAGTATLKDATALIEDFKELAKESRAERTEFRQHITMLLATLQTRTQRGGPESWVSGHPADQPPQ